MLLSKPQSRHLSSGYLSVSLGSNKSQSVTWPTILYSRIFERIDYLYCHDILYSFFLNSDFITDARVLIDFYIISLPMYSYSSNLV